MIKILGKYLDVFWKPETKVSTKNILFLIPVYYLLILFFAYLPSLVDYEIIKTFSFIPMFVSFGCLLWLVVILPLNIAKNKGLITNEKQLNGWYFYLFFAYPVALVHTIFATNKLKSSSTP